MNNQPTNQVTNIHFPFQDIETKWQAYWQKIDLYQTGQDPDKPDIYILDFFPYPSGSGLSVGHGRNYVPTCVTARFYRMQGYNVLHPMGWDAFGLPAENYAVNHGIHPAESTRIFSDTYRRQMKLLECSYDWSREINSTDPDYYRWTQWFFLLLHQRGLAYRAAGSQWWCPHCQTILANEQVEAGCCWRCDSPVAKKQLAQWYFKITAYADRLLADLDDIDWPEAIKTMQRNWIGRSEGAEVRFQVGAETIAVFTTRPDTLYGVTFLVLAPEHPLLAEITTPEQAPAVSAYIQQAIRQTEMDRLAADQEKSGVFTGAYATHPLTDEAIPIWVADYVLLEYGTGAVMGVPGHDERDFAFARHYNLPVITVIQPENDQHRSEDGAYTGYGIMVNSGPYTGQPSTEGIAGITQELTVQGKGKRQTITRMRDWLISRQRYWGAPIPIIHCPDCGPVPVPESELPVRLPDTADFAPSGDGRSPLARIDEWVNTACPHCDGPGRRETDTMDGFACSSWYFLRFANPHFSDGPFDPAAVQRWLPVDIYVGGAEHAVMHLLYARFWTKVMADAGLIDFVEPFQQLKNQGMLLSAIDGRKMSKSRGNVVTPDEVAARYGIDALRAYLLFLGPFDTEVVWKTAGIKGVVRFLDRFWRLATEPVATGGQLPVDVPDMAFERERHKIIKRMTDDMAQFRFNTAVAALMTYLNYLIAVDQTTIFPPQWVTAIETFTLLLAPICPFISEEVWQTVLQRTGSVHQQAWPTYIEVLTQAEMVEMPVQVNGKVRDHITVPLGTTRDVVKETAVAAPNAQRHINGQIIRKIIIVPDRLVNIVV